MSQRRSPAVRRQANARRTISMVAARPAGVLLQRSDEAFPDEDSVDTGLGEEVGREPAWQSAEVSETVAEALVAEEPSRLAPTAGVDAVGTPGTERLIRRYVQEAGTVPLLTAMRPTPRGIVPTLHAMGGRHGEEIKVAIKAHATPPEA